MAWHHLPIVDLSTPNRAFESAWTMAGFELRARLRSGENVLIHCKGGLGRAGTIAARLLVEHGWTADAAIEAVRVVRRGAIETRAQEEHVQSIGPVNEPMVIHNSADAELWRENTLSKPYHKGPDGRLKQFDFIVANPPFSDKAWSTGLDPEHDEFGRFAYGTPPAKNGDYAYLLHVLASMKSTGKAVVVMPHGVLFRGNAEADIRRELLKRGFIKAIIGLPANLFYGTGIPACLIVLDKEHASARKGIFMIDASKGFVKDGNKNRLREQDVHKIVDVFQRSIEIAGYSRMVPMAEISANEGNLNIPRYIDGSEAEDLQDIEAHLKGGIPARDVDALQEYWDVMPGLRDDLFGPGDRPGYLAAKVEPTEVRATIHAHPEFEAFAATVRGIFAAWRDANIEELRGFDKGDHPADLIHTLSEDLLARFAAPPSVSDEAIRLAVVTRMGWIKRQQAKFAAQARQSNRAYVSGETHFHLGTAYRLRVVNRKGSAQVGIVGDRIELSVPPGNDRAFRERVFQRWQRQVLRERIQPLVDHWAQVLGVPTPEFGIKRMRTKWGSCSTAARRIWLNLELVKKPPVCIDYLICHEVAHLIERSHGDRFVALLDRNIPRWRVIRAELNNEPLGPEKWDH